LLYIKHLNYLFRQAGLTGEETIKETTKKLEDQLENLDLNKIKDVENLEEDELNNIPTFCEEFKNYYSKDKDGEADGEEYPNEFEDIDEEEQDDFTIHKTDTLIACATAQDDISNIEIYIYDEINQSLFVHHDILLGTYPICLEWLPINQNNSGNTKNNYVIVGSFLPEIEFWNLDMLDVLEPDLVLGEKGGDEDKYFKDLKKKKKNKQEKLAANADNVNSHSDAVLSLNVNPFNNNILCSGGADSKILFWDIASGKSSRCIKEHKDKVQSVKWNKMEDNVLVSGSYDKTIKLFDVRDNNSCMNVQISSDVENIEWNPLNKYLFLSSYENGKIDLYDIRKFDTILSFQAHKKAATGISFCNKKEGLFTSVGLDSYVKVWDCENAINGSESGVVQPTLICERFVKKSIVINKYFFKFFEMIPLHYFY